VLTGKGKYPREVDLYTARNIFSTIRGKAKGVALSMSDNINEICQVIKETKPDIIHIGAKEEDLNVKDLKKIRLMFPKIEIMRSVYVTGKESIRIAKSYENTVDYLLLDTLKKGKLGATGEPHDWNISKKIVALVKIPVILAGGIGPDNVAEAIRNVKPAGIDSKTKTDKSNGEGKDLEKVKKLVTIVKQIEREMRNKIILASTSPRRKKLLKQVGIRFDIIQSYYKEENLKLPPHKLVMYLAHEKAKNVAKRRRNGIVVGADTLLFLDNKAIGKPKNKDEAIKLLRILSGKNVRVYSGIAIIDTSNGRTIKDYEVTEMKIARVSEEEIRSYVETKEPLDKAGAIAIQGIGSIFIEKINGCYSNVVGLPLHCLYKNLKKLGVSILGRKSSE